MRDVLARYDHPAWVSMVGVFVGYALILTVVFVVFFLVPFLVWP